MTNVQKGRRRQQALFDLLGQYQAATTHQLAALVWNGNERLARENLLAYTQAGQLHRLPHPIYRHGPFVYTSRKSRRNTTHSQKILHHLAAMDLHIAVARSLGRYGVRTIPEMPWGPGLQPDQTVVLRDAVWAVEHHLSGQFSHAADYRRFVEEGEYESCHWWREGLRLGLLVITGGAGAVDHVVGQLQRHIPPGLTWRVTTRENVLRDPGQWLLK